MIKKLICLIDGHNDWHYIYTFKHSDRIIRIALVECKRCGKKSWNFVPLKPQPNADRRCATGEIKSTI